jgi:hypothetical protein
LATARFSEICDWGKFGIERASWGVCKDLFERNG